MDQDATPTGATVQRKPHWLKRNLETASSSTNIQAIMHQHGLDTVCVEAKCPNRNACWSRGTATFLLMGDTCTRSCGFCAIKTRKHPGPLDPNEPRKVAMAIKQMGVRYAVLTSVDRDDLPDGGSRHFAQTVRTVRRMAGCRVETLTPDFSGCRRDVVRVLDARPDCFAHNIETVARLHPRVRPQGDYDRSLTILGFAKQYAPHIRTKSSLMVGLGETLEEAVQVLRDLRRVRCDAVTVGQYLQPTSRHLPVHRYATPDEFRRLETKARELGFLFVASGPFVRSSYQAETLFHAT